MRHKLRTIRLTFAAIIAAAFFVLLVFILSKSENLQQLPDPNGYDDFVNAGEMLTGDLPGFQELRDMGENELRAALTTTALVEQGEALALAKVGLTRASQVPLDYDPTSSTRLDKLSAIKRVAIAFIAVGRLAEIQNRECEAAESYLDLIRLGHESARGGNMLDSMSGRSIEAIGLQYLEKLAPKLGTNCCRETALALETIDDRSESAEDILRREKEWARRTDGLRGQLRGLLVFRSLNRSEQQTAGRIRGQKVRRQQLLVELAVRAYQLENGERPGSLSMLSPNYLKEIPKDIFAGTNLVFNP